MNAGRWQEVKALFEAALERPQPDRAAFLAATVTDPETRREVESLLAAHREDNFLGEGVGLHAAAAIASETSPAGQRVGAYRIIKAIGEGGMGVVFLAERDDETFEKQVAIKVARPGALSGSAMRRFRQERQIIATLEHPYIARLLDGGTTSDGLPYFVLEYVEGTPLEAWCVAHQQSVRDRIQLFLLVCSAVEYAHAHGVVHRDLKPHNILVTQDGTPRLLDFGIATELGAGADTGFTAAAMMTPEYASPEQIRGEAPSPAIDVYALGVLLHRLLSGGSPYRVRTGAAHELARAICEQEPEKPSAILATKGDRTRAAVVRGDLDSIVLTSMRKEPDQRYGSVAALADDLRRHLDGRPVAARGNETLYRAAKLVRRHKGRLAAALIVAISLAAAGWAVFQTRGRPASSPSGRTLAVLPFKPLGPGGADEYLALGMADALITRLANIRGLVVRPTSSVAAYADHEKVDPSTAGRQLGVDALVDGRFQRAGDRVRVTVQLLDVANGATLWASSFDEPFSNVFAVQDAISQRVAEELVASLTPDDRSRLMARSTGNPEAYQLYVRGRYFWEKRTADALRKSIEYYRQAIERDPSYALAFAGLADSYNILGNASVLPPGETYPQAKAAAAEALRLDDRLSQARIAMAFATYLYDRDWTRAESMFEQALAEAPNYGPGHQWYAVCLLSRGRFEEARREMGQAVAVDPSSVAINAVEAWVSFLSRRYGDAIAQANRALEMDNDSLLAHNYLALTHTARNEYAEAAHALRPLVANADREPRVLGLMGLGFARTGRVPAARHTIDQLKDRARIRHVPVYNESLVRIGLGEHDEAITLLERAADEHFPWTIHFNVDPLLDPLRQDRRFRALLRRAAIPEIALPPAR